MYFTYKTSLKRCEILNKLFYKLTLPIGIINPEINIY